MHKTGDNRTERTWDINSPSHKAMCVGCTAAPRIPVTDRPYASEYCLLLVPTYVT